MANLFRKIVLVNCQQVRYLPRWGPRRPAGIIPPEEYDPKTDSVISNKEFSEQKRHEKNIEETSKYSKINWKKPPKNNLPKEYGFSEKPQRNTKHAKPLTIPQKLKTKAPKPNTVDMLEATIDSGGELIYTKMENNDIRITKIMADVKSRKVKESQGLMLLEGKMLIKDALQAGCKLDYLLFSRRKEVDYLKPYLPKCGSKFYKMPYKELQEWSDLVTNPGIMGIFKIPDTESFEPVEPLPLTIICDNVREPSNLGAILRTSGGVGCEKLLLTKGCVNVWETKVLRSACGAHFKLNIAKKSSWNDIKTTIPAKANVFIADNNTCISKDSSEDSLAHLVARIPVLPYFSVNFKMSKHVVLIIGGETEGISEDSYKLAEEYNGVRLNVPLSNGLDSLNTGTALGIIAFEVKRQLTLMKQENLEDYKVRNMSLNT